MRAKLLSVPLLFAVGLTLWTMRHTPKFKRESEDAKQFAAGYAKGRAELLAKIDWQLADLAETVKRLKDSAD